MTANTAEHSVFDIANWFLARAMSENKDLKPMKLQKLVYFAYGWYYAYFDKPLFPEAIFAWKFGPVVGDLYGRFKRFGGKPIMHVDVLPNFDSDTLSILNDVWDSYSPCTDIHLSTSSFITTFCPF
jgi:uncharacterized phage-associated protein